MSRVSQVLSLLGCFAICGLLGCGGADEPERERTVQVTGNVKYKDQPVADAAVAFIPETELGKTAEKKGAFGKTDASGNFTLTTFVAGDGAVPGKYTVTVQKKEIVTTSEVDIEDPNYVPPDENAPAPAPPKDLLPVQYSQPLKSPLKVEIIDGENPPVQLELKD